MKRVLAILLVFMLLPAACAQVIQIDDKTIHAYALDYLSRINDANSVAEAVEMFGEITSGYGYSSLYQVYSQAIAAIHAEDMDNAESLLALLAFYPEFEVSLTENSLPLCTDLQTYIEARRAESEGRVIDAMSLYRTINLLDSVQRSVALINLWQAEAYAYAGELFTAGDYEAAADLYAQLGNYSDSASMAERAKALIPTPTPEVTASPTPAPTPVPEYKPLRKGDRGDEVLALQKRLYELGYFSDVRDGIYGGKTVDAVKLFQYAVNLEATGTADRLTLILLYSDNPFEAQNSAPALETPAPTPEPTPEYYLTPEPTIEPTAEPTPEPTPAPTAYDNTLGMVNYNSTREAILDLQNLLVELRLMVASDANGVYNSATLNAVRAFQMWTNEEYGAGTVPVNGDADALTIAYMRYSIETGNGPASEPAQQQAQQPVQQNNPAAAVSQAVYCYDEASVLSENFEQTINYAVQRLSEACGAEIVVATVDTTGGMSIQDYGAKVFETYSIGDPEKRNGFLLLMAITDDNYYVLTGDGLDALFPSEKLREYFALYLEPDFAVRQYERGASRLINVVYAEIAAMYGVSYS